MSSAAQGEVAVDVRAEIRVLDGSAKKQTGSTADQDVRAEVRVFDGSVKKQTGSTAEQNPAPVLKDRRVDLGPCKMDDFEIKRVVGTGSFGRVSVCKHKKTGLMCAMKALSKAAMVKNGQVKHVKEEKEVMRGCGHPNLVQFRGSFQDEECVYLVMEYVQGGEFFTHLRDHGRLKEEEAIFYAAQVVLGLEYLHSKNIAYRDLKPENLLLDKDGYLKITDFGFAKVVPRRTFTLCGTPDYLAPEIILNKGHGKAVDWWAVGVLIFELMNGFPPFYDEDTMNTYRKIIAMKYEMPGHFSIPLRDLVRRLLQADLTYRLGNLVGGAQDIKDHPWFRNIDWVKLEERKIRAPYVPKLKGFDDCSRFDDYSKLGPMKHEFNLTAAQQALFDGHF